MSEAAADAEPPVSEDEDAFGEEREKSFGGISFADMTACLRKSKKAHIAAIAMVFVVICSILVPAVQSSRLKNYYAKTEEMRDSYQTLIDKYSGGNTYLLQSENDEISCRFHDKYAELIDDTIKYRMDVHYRKGSGCMSGCMIGSQATDTVSSGHYYTILFDDDGLCKFYFDVVGQLFMIKYTAYDDAKAYYYEGELIKFNDVFKYHHNRGNDALGSDSYEAFAEWASDNVYSQSSEYRERSLIYGMSVDND